MRLSWRDEGSVPARIRLGLRRSRQELQRVSPCRQPTDSKILPCRQLRTFERAKNILPIIAPYASAHLRRIGGNEKAESKDRSRSCRGTAGRRISERWRGSESAGGRTPPLASCIVIFAPI